MHHSVVHAVHADCMLIIYFAYIFVQLAVVAVHAVHEFEVLYVVMCPTL